MYHTENVNTAHNGRWNDFSIDHVGVSAFPGVHAIALELSFLLGIPLVVYRSSLSHVRRPETQTSQL